MAQRQKLRKVLIWLAPTLLSAVAVIQRYFVHAHHLNSWKGGGFGMFSVIDHPRAVTVSFNVPEFPDLRIRTKDLLRFMQYDAAFAKKIADVIQMPEDSAIQHILEQLGAMSWSWFIPSLLPTASSKVNNCQCQL